MSALMALRALLLSLLLPTVSASSFKSIEELAAAALSVVVPEAPPQMIQKSSGSETDQGNETDTEEEDDDEDDSAEVDVVSDKKAASQGAALVQVHHTAEKSEKQVPKAPEHAEIQKQAAKPLPTVPAVHPSQAVEALPTVLLAKPSQAEEMAHSYGPHGCVKTFLAEKSRTCIVKTECSMSPGFAEFDMGFRCASAGGGSDDSTAVVHLFGAKSFAAQETFDTKIGCAKCLPLEDKHQTVNDLASEVISLRQNLDAVSSSVNGLQQKVISAIQLRGGHGQ